eukprot:6635495-Prorocentrum_lima.AAC.1
MPSRSAAPMCGWPAAHRETAGHCIPRPRSACGHLGGQGTSWSHEEVGLALHGTRPRGRHVLLLPPTGGPVYAGGPTCCRQRGGHLARQAQRDSRGTPSASYQLGGGLGAARGPAWQRASALSPASSGTPSRI